MRPDQAFGGPTAALIHDLPLPAQWERDPSLHVVALGSVRMRRPGVVATRSTSGTIVRVDGLPVLDPVSTWVSLATVLGVDDLVAVGDRLVTGDRGRRPVAGIHELRCAVEEAEGRRHVRALRAALPLIRVGAWSRPETHLRLLVMRAGLPEPQLNARVVLRGGRAVRPDISWASRRVALEYDGSAFHGRSDWDVDASRHELLIDEGWTVVRVRADDLYRSPVALAARLRHRLLFTREVTNDR